MTKLESEVTRETTLVVDGREVDVTLVPANEAAATPESLEFHLKGTQQRKRIPLPMLLRLAGWEVKVKGAKKAERPDPAEEIRKLFESPELQALEREVLGNR